MSSGFDSHAMAVIRNEKQALLREINRLNRDVASRDATIRHLHADCEGLRRRIRVMSQFLGAMLSNLNGDLVAVWKKYSSLLKDLGYYDPPTYRPGGGNEF